MAGNLKAILAEFIGTFVWVFLGAGAVCADALTGGRLGPVGVALAHGLGLAAVTTAFARLSGAHFNPALTTALVLQGRVNWIKAVFFVTAQLLGAALSGIFLRAALGQHPELATAAPFLGSCGLTGIGFKAATLVEAVGAFLLVLVYYACFVQSSLRDPSRATALGAAYAGFALVAGPLTGAALNPARAFGPALASGHWSHWWVFWLGPFAGAIAAAWLYETLYLDKKAPD